MFRRLTATQLGVDVGIAVLAVALRSTMLFASPLLWAVVLLMASALALRRLSPGLALTVAWAGALLQITAMLPPDVSNIAILPVLFATGRYGSRLVRWLGLASAVLGAVISSVYITALPGIFGVSPAEVGPFFRAFSVLFVGAIATLGLSWTIGLLVRTWDNARQSRRDQLAAEQSMIVEQERNRIARDMHDVVAHSLAVVIAQADGARYAGGKEATDAALSTISSTAREALSDVRLLLGQLRHNQEEGPQPVLADLDRLVDQMRASGLVVVLERTGTAVALPATRELALFRIAQEALTNALRHGDPGRPVEVVLAWEPGAAALTVTNESAPGAAEAVLGHGLAGMRERALLVGGTFEAGHRDGSWTVHTRIPA